MIDGMVVAGYLGLIAARAAGRFVDRRLDVGLEALLNSVRAKLGRNPASELARQPGPDARQRIAGEIEHAARNDRLFSDDLARIVAQLDRNGGRNVITTVYGPYVQGGRDAIYAPITNRGYSDPRDPRDAPSWVKAMIVVGFLGLLTGVAILVFGVVGYDGRVPSPTDLPNFGVSAGLIGGSLVLLVISQLIVMLTRRN
ncbi:hypothetical protein LFM09_19850 [Lentzea alba]|uniref:hypothetical protein n=1 Tax=Lentzea alba TaxID=2714351 RepID=UPI0039BEDEE6